MSKNHVTFSTVEMLSLYATMALKRIVITNSSFPEKLSSLAKVIETNLMQLKVDKQWFLGTLRDHARLHRNDWSYVEAEEDKGCMRYNSLLLVLALRLGLERVWPTDLNFMLYEDLVMELVPKVCPDLNLKHLNKHDPMFTRFYPLANKTEVLVLPDSTARYLEECNRFRNLRVLEYEAKVPENVLFLALWSIATKNRDFIQEIVYSKKEEKPWKVNLPHLEVLRQTVTERCPHKLCLNIGAIAMALQPKMEVVELVNEWDTFNAILQIVQIESFIKGTIPRKFNVKHLKVRCSKYTMQNIKQVVSTCPKLSSVELANTENINSELSILCSIIPFEKVTVLEVDASPLTDLELTVFLWRSKNLRELTLSITPRELLAHNLPVTLLTKGFPEEEARRISMYPSIKKLTLKFRACELSEEEYTLEHVEDFLRTFRWVEEFYLEDAVLAPSHFLINGCIKGAMEVFDKLKHLSIISCKRSIPCDYSRLLFTDYCPIVYKIENMVKNGRLIPSLLMQLQDDITFERLKKLKTMEIDEFYLHQHLDYFVESLRLAGVLVSIFYRGNGGNDCRRLAPLIIDDETRWKSMQKTIMKWIGFKPPQQDLH